MGAGLVRYDRDWLRDTAGFLEGAGARATGIAEDRVAAAGEAAAYTYPETTRAVAASTEAAQDFAAEAAAVEDVYGMPQAGQLRRLAATLDGYELQRWEGVELVSWVLFAAGNGKPWDLRGGAWADDYASRAETDVVPFVTADVDPDLAALTERTRKAVLELEGLAAYRVSGGGAPWTIQVVVQAARGEWSNVVRRSGGSARVSLGALQFSVGSSTSLVKRNVDLLVVASDGRDWAVRRVPDTWIVGKESAVRAGGGGEAEVKGVRVGGAGEVERSSAVDLAHDGAPRPGGKTGWLHTIGRPSP